MLHSMLRAATRKNYYETVMVDSPVAYWRLGESSGTAVVNEVGSGNGTYYGVTLNQSGALASDSNTAISFDGTNDYVALPTMSPLSDTFSYEMWFRTTWVTTDTGNRQYLNTRQQDPSSAATYTFIERQGGLIAGDITEFQYYIGSGERESLTSNVKVLANTWYHFVCVGDGTGAQMYLNGVEVASSTNAPVSTAVSEHLLGWRSDAQGDDWFGGLIDEYSVYDYALSPNRIEAHYNAGTT